MWQGCESAAWIPGRLRLSCRKGLPSQPCAGCVTYGAGGMPDASPMPWRAIGRVGPVASATSDTRLTSPTLTTRLALSAYVGPFSIPCGGEDFLSGPRDI